MYANVCMHYIDSWEAPAMQQQQAQQAGLYIFIAVKCAQNNGSHKLKIAAAVAGKLPPGTAFMGSSVGAFTATEFGAAIAALTKARAQSDARARSLCCAKAKPYTYTLIYTCMCACIECVSACASKCSFVRILIYLGQTAPRHTHTHTFIVFKCIYMHTHKQMRLFTWLLLINCCYFTHIRFYHL